MQDTNSDTEYFVDVPRQQIAPADTWNTLSVNQLIETKNALTTRLYAFQNQPSITKTLTASIARLDQLISSRLASS